MDWVDAYLAKVDSIVGSIEEKQRVVKDPSYWNADEGTPIVPGDMKPVTRSAHTAIARGRETNSPFVIEVDGGMFVEAVKWDDVPQEFKDALRYMPTHQWVEDPQYDGVEAFVEKGTMKALIVKYADDTFDMDAEFKDMVRTPAGARKYKQPIDTEIVADGPDPKD